MIPYIGGKYYLAKWIVDHFPKDYQKMTYVEPFGGAGWVLLKKEPSRCEVYNDLNEDLVNLFTVIRDNRREFLSKAKWTFHSRKMFSNAKEKIKSSKFGDVTDRAIHYALSRVISFSGTGTTYGFWKIGRSSSWNAFLKRLLKLRGRFQTMQMECLDFEKVIEKFDSEHTLFYLDPPYVDAEHYYKTGFGMKDHKRLAELLKNIKGKFVLSYYPHPTLDELYKDFEKITKEVPKHSCGITKNFKSRVKPKATEMLIRNF